MPPATVGIPISREPRRSMPWASADASPRGPASTPGRSRAGPAWHNRCELRRSAGPAAARPAVRRPADRTQTRPRGRKATSNIHARATPLGGRMITRKEIPSTTGNAQENQQCGKEQGTWKLNVPRGEVIISPNNPHPSGAVWGMSCISRVAAIFYVFCSRPSIVT